METNYNYEFTDTEKINYTLLNKKLFKKWKETGRIEYYQKIITVNIRLCGYEANKFSNTGYDIEELASEGVIGLIKAVNTFDMDREIKFATYATRCIDNEILMYIRRNKKTRDDVSFEEALHYDMEGNKFTFADILGTDSEEVAHEVINNIIDKTANAEIERTMDICNLSDLEKMVLNLRFGLDGNKPLNQLEVANAVEYSQSYISRIERRAKTKILNSSKHHLRDYRRE